MRFEILCQRCGRPVDRVETYREPGGWDTLVTAYCHGDRETRDLSPFDLRAIREGVVLGGTAFRVVVDPAMPEGFARVSDGRGGSILMDLRD